MTDVEKVEIDLEKTARESADDPERVSAVTSAITGTIRELAFANWYKNATPWEVRILKQSEMEELSKVGPPNYHKKKTIPRGMSAEHPYGNPNGLSDYATWTYSPKNNELNFKTVVLSPGTGLPEMAFHHYLRGGYKDQAANKNAMIDGCVVYGDMVKSILSRSMLLTYKEHYVRKMPDGPSPEFITVGGRRAGKSAAFKLLCEDITRFYLAVRCGYRGSFEEWKKESPPLIEWVNNGQSDHDRKDPTSRMKIIKEMAAQVECVRQSGTIRV